MLDGIFYTFYWRRCNNGDADIALLATIVAISVIPIPYVGLFWFLESLLPISVIGLVGAKLPMYGSCGLITGIVTYHFLWHKRYKFIIQQHEKYDNRKYRRLTNLYIASFFFGSVFLGFIGWLINTLRACD